MSSIRYPPSPLAPNPTNLLRPLNGSPPHHTTPATPTRARATPKFLICRLPRVDPDARALSCPALALPLPFPALPFPRQRLPPRHVNR